MKSDQTTNGAQREYFSVFDGGGREGTLAVMATGLLKKQKKNWPALREGHAALANSQTREIDGGSWKAQIQFNPRRIVSSAAKIDPESIKRRPCFLCPENIPVEQEAIKYRHNWNILCNPAPIFPSHLTIAALRHTPQSLMENLGMLLSLADDFGIGTTVFYNGPRAGASAPDHLHFQAAPSGLMPIEKDADIQGRGAGWKSIDGAEISRTKGLARGVLVIRGQRALAVAASVERILTTLAGRPTAWEGEPPLNILCSRAEKGWRLLLFPRLKHRPDAYFREGDGQLVISPGAIDMGGVIITPREGDFNALTAEKVAGIYREVAFDDTMTGALLSEL
jgi:hypothetical protein